MTDKAILIILIFIAFIVGYYVGNNGGVINLSENFSCGRSPPGSQEYPVLGVGGETVKNRFWAPPDDGSLDGSSACTNGVVNGRLSSTEHQCCLAKDNLNNSFNCCTRVNQEGNCAFGYWDDTPGQGKNVYNFN